jgi:methionine aminotransferase
LADFMTEHPEHHIELPAFYQSKRDYFLSLLAGSRFSFEPSFGTFFQLLNYEAISQERDTVLAERWTKEIGVASIPVSAFYEDPEAVKTPILRFCFAKDDATLERAAEILCSL